MATCSTLSKNILGFDCAKPLVTGVDDRIVLINVNDINRDLCKFDPQNPLLMTDLILKTGKKGYSVTGYNLSNDYDTALAKGTYIDGYEHNLMFRIFNISAETKLWIDSLKNTRVVAIVGNKVSPGHANDKYEVLGWDLGLEVMELTRNQKDADTRGGFVIKLAVDETNKESSLPYTLFKTDATTTETLVESLIATA